MTIMLNKDVMKEKYTMNDVTKDERGDKTLPILKQDKIIHQQSFIEFRFSKLTMQRNWSLPDKSRIIVSDQAS